MTIDAPACGYSHIQKSPLSLILFVVALACWIPASIIGDSAGVIVAGIVGLVLAILATAFHYLKVIDLGDMLAIRFGPLPVFRRTVNYSEIQSTEVGRTLILDGWGIHMSVRGGWVWNLWGRECVVVHFKNGDTLRIGTDDGENLAAFLQSRLSG
jgi:hypothetical protein